MRVFAHRPSHPSAGRVYQPATLPERRHNAPDVAGMNGVANSAAARYGSRHACPLGSGCFVDESRGVVKPAVAELGSLEFALALWLFAGRPGWPLAAQP